MPLPDGLALNPDSGVLSGTPIDAGNFPLTVTFTDTAGRSDVATLTLVVEAAPHLETVRATAGWAHSVTSPGPGQAWIAGTTRSDTGPFLAVERVEGGNSTVWELPVPANWRPAAIDISASAPDDVWVASDELWHFDGAAWVRVPAPAGVRTFVDVVDIPGPGVYFGARMVSDGWDERIMRYDETGWTDLGFPAPGAVLDGLEVVGGVPVLLQWEYDAEIKDFSRARFATYTSTGWTRSSSSYVNPAGSQRAFWAARTPTDVTLDLYAEDWASMRCFRLIDGSESGACAGATARLTASALLADGRTLMLGGTHGSHAGLRTADEASIAPVQTVGGVSWYPGAMAAEPGTGGAWVIARVDPPGMNNEYDVLQRYVP